MSLGFRKLPKNSKLSFSANSALSTYQRKTITSLIKPLIFSAKTARIIVGTIFSDLLARKQSAEYSKS